MVTRSLRRFAADPRHFQLLSLSLLLTYGIVRLDFDLGPIQVFVTLASVVVAQYLGTRLWKLPSFEARSALISGLSLCLLLRTNEPFWAAIAGFVSIFSKLAIRMNGKHVFNPTSFGLVFVLLVSDEVWISGGQWGSAAAAAFFFACLGSIVVHRAERSDVTFAFLASHAALTFGRALWLGDPIAIPIHQLQNGALLLFAFFMISDPKTTPDSRLGRVVFALLVAVVAYYIRFKLFENNSLIWSLVLVSFSVRLIDHLLPGTRHEWPRWAASRTT
jgi:enediyne biosynthesis protein E5